jgi:hypothetical protein
VIDEHLMHCGRNETNGSLALANGKASLRCQRLIIPSIDVNQQYLLFSHSQFPIFSPVLISDFLVIHKPTSFYQSFLIPYRQFFTIHFVLFVSSFHIHRISLC